MTLRILSLFILTVSITFNAYTQGSFPFTPYIWPVPPGGAFDNGHYYGFNNVTDEGTYIAGDQGWDLIDMNGDNLPDLVIHSEGTGSFRDCFGLPTSPHWRVYLNYGGGFAGSYITWVLPAGGSLENGHNFGFNAIGDADSVKPGDQGWGLMDMNGDHRPELVVFSEGTGTDNDCFGLPANPHWNVYLNYGTSFSTTPASWILPIGGTLQNGHASGFNNLFRAGTSVAGDQGWAVRDLNNDQLPDIIVCSEGTGTYNDCPGLPSNPRWYLYLNNGAGFVTTATFFTVPAGGVVSNGHNFGFNSLENPGSYAVNYQGWALMDMNDDGFDDLVLHSEGIGQFQDVFGNPASPHWRVYEGSATGFNSNFFSWTVPQGGKLDAMHAYGFNNISYTGTVYNGNQGWGVFDINGDDRPDLVLHSEGNGTVRECFGLPSNPRWNVFFNSGSGFAQNVYHWRLPQGGQYVNNHDYGFNLFNDPGSYANGDQGWAIRDMNGDGLIDLVVHSQGNGSYRDCFGIPGNPHWKVFFGDTTLSAVESLTLLNEINIYPNPVVDFINVEMNPSINHEGLKLSITDLTGSVVWEQVLETISEQIDVRNLYSGIYLIRISGNETFYKKFVKL